MHSNFPDASRMTVGKKYIRKNFDKALKKLMVKAVWTTGSESSGGTRHVPGGGNETLVAYAFLWASMFYLILINR